MIDAKAPSVFTAHTAHSRSNLALKHIKTATAPHEYPYYDARRFIVSLYNCIHPPLERRHSVTKYRIIQTARSPAQLGETFIILTAFIWFLFQINPVSAHPFVISLPPSVCLSV